jgi:soluble lytic murein transglycosylase
MIAGKARASRLLLIQFYGSRIEEGTVPRPVLNLMYPVPPDLKPVYLKSASRVGLDPLLAMAVTLQESGFDRDALSHNLAGGLMQVMPELFKRFSSQWSSLPDNSDYRHPENSIRVGTEYLAWLLDHFDGSLARSLAAYNAGEHRVQQWNLEYPYDDEVWIEHIPFKQTRLFVKHVMENYKNYSLLYGHLPEFSVIDDESQD